nr:helix-turn-helix domain-containing protein [Pseudoclavibacter helvolus]
MAWTPHRRRRSRDRAWPEPARDGGPARTPGLQNVRVHLERRANTTVRGHLHDIRTASSAAHRTRFRVSHGHPLRRAPRSADDHAPRDLCLDSRPPGSTPTLRIPARFAGKRVPDGERSHLDRNRGRHLGSRPFGRRRHLRGAHRGDVRLRQFRRQRGATVLNVRDRDDNSGAPEAGVPSRARLPRRSHEVTAIYIAPRVRSAPQPHSQRCPLAGARSGARESIRRARGASLSGDRGERPPSASFTANDVARELGVVRRTLDRAYAREGLSISDKLRLQRARRARQLLIRHPSLSLRDIAEQSGFSSPQVMRRALDRYYEAAPAAIRRSHEVRTSGAPE